MERVHEHQPHQPAKHEPTGLEPVPQLPGVGTPLRPGQPAPAAPLDDAAAAAVTATTGAAEVPLEPSVMTLTIKTTGTNATRIIATPDTTVGEVMVQACRDLGVPDAARYVLVARGEVIANTRQTLRAFTGNHVEEELTIRLVKKPEAGLGLATCDATDRAQTLDDGWAECRF